MKMFLYVCTYLTICIYVYYLYMFLFYQIIWFKLINWTEQLQQTTFMRNWLIVFYDYLKNETTEALYLERIKVGWRKLGPIKNHLGWNMFYVNFIFRDLKHFDQNCPSLHSVKRQRFSFFSCNDRILSNYYERKCNKDIRTFK